MEVVSNNIKIQLVRAFFVLEELIIHQTGLTVMTRLVDANAIWNNLGDSSVRT